MFKPILGGMGMTLAFAYHLQAITPQRPVPATVSQSSQHRATLDRYCVTCHNEKLRTADLTLDELDIENVGDRAPVWEKVIRKLRSGAMPPAGIRRPDKATYDSLIGYLETTVDRAAEAKPNP